jgi:hypothetical protein
VAKELLPIPFQKKAHFVAPRSIIPKTQVDVFTLPRLSFRLKKRFIYSKDFAITILIKSS